MNQLTIPRERWINGRYFSDKTDNFGCKFHPVYGHASLLNDKGFRCCLGILGQFKNLSDEDALEIELPQDVPGNANWPEELFHETTAYAPYVTLPAQDNMMWDSVFAAINDTHGIDDDIRESWIATGFKEVLGIEVIFTGEYPPI